MKMRQAISADNVLLSSMNVDVQRLHAESHPDIFKMPQNDDFAVAFFDEMLANQQTWIFIAEEGEQALGYVMCKLIERAENPFTFEMRYLSVDQISVRAEARGKGVGTALIQRAKELAVELHVPQIQLGSWAFNTKAHSFFERMGFVKFNHRFWQNL